MKINSSYRSIMVIFVILAAVCALIWEGLVYKSYKLKSDIAEISAKAQYNTSRNAYLLSLKGTLEKMSEDLDVINKKFISKDKIPTIIDDIETRARAIGIKVDIGSVNLDEAVDPSVPHALRLHVSGIGSWKNDISFISTIENLPYTARVEGLDMSYSASLWTFNTDLVIYVVN